MRTARVTVVVPCVCVCVCVCVCMYSCVSVRSFLPPRASRRRKYRYVRVHRDTEKTFMIMIFTKSASFRSYGVICLPPMPPTTLKPQRRIQRNQLKVGKPLIVATLTENASFRSHGTFAYVLRVHIHNINMRRYITSARGHELSGRVHAHALIIMPGLNARGLQSKLLITPLSKWSHNIIIMQVWCILKSVRLLWAYCLAGYIYCTAQ